MLDIEELKRLYLDEGMSHAEIGRKFGFTKQNIAKRLKRAGIKARGKGGLRKPAVDEVTLRRLYVEEGLQIKDVADRTGKHSGTVSKYLDHYQIPKRTDTSKELRPILREIKVGESFEAPIQGSKWFYNRFYDMANKYGVKVSVRRVSDDLLRITRVK